MTIMLPVLAVAFSAFYVWLTVRIVNRRERWAKWAAVGVGIPVIYVLGIGPVAWFARDAWPGDWRNEMYRISYYPLFSLMELDYDYRVPEHVNGGGAFYRAIYSYLDLWGASSPAEYLDL
jgi:hypothetical protein